MHAFASGQSKIRRQSCFCRHFVCSAVAHIVDYYVFSFGVVVLRLVPYVCRSRWAWKSSRWELVPLCGFQTPECRCVCCARRSSDWHSVVTTVVDAVRYVSWPTDLCIIFVIIIIKHIYKARFRRMPQNCYTLNNNVFSLFLNVIRVMSGDLSSSRRLFHTWGP